MSRELQVINGYQLTTELTFVGAGTARWAFAKKDGKEWFIKEFLSPIYPTAAVSLSSESRRDNALACKAFEAEKNALYSAIREADNGNIIVIKDFFRFETKYYIVSEKIQEGTFTASKVSLLPHDKVLLLMKILTHSLIRLEKLGIVHADLKPSNILLKPTVNNYLSLKLIDFDNSFFVHKQPDNPDDVQGDLVYMAPEVYLRMCGEAVNLTEKIDVFAAGILFHEFLTGDLPAIGADDDYIFLAALNHSAIKLNAGIPEPLRALIAAMIDIDPSKRPSFTDVFAVLSNDTLASARIADDIEATKAKALVKEEKSVSPTMPASENKWMRKPDAL